MAYYKLNTDGTIQSRSKQVDDTWLPLSELETKEDGSYYTYYKQDGTADLEKEAKQDLELYKVKVKEAIFKAIDTMRIEVDGLGFDANKESQVLMRGKFDTLAKLSKESTLWRLYDNTDVEVTPAQLEKAYLLADELTSRLWFCRSVEEVKAVVEVDNTWLDKYEEII